MARWRHGVILGVCVALMLALAAESAEARRRRRARRSRSQPVVPALTVDGLPNVRSGSAMAIDMDTNTIVYGKNPDTVRAIASTG